MRSARSPLGDGHPPGAGPPLTSGGLAVLPHTRGEDVFGLVTGTVLASFGIFALSSAGVVTGGTAGLGLLLGYVTGVPFGWVFPLVNLPFFALAVWAKGWGFTVRSLACVVAVSAATGVHALGFEALSVAPLYAALLGNLCAGVGILIVFRHGSSLGGFGILALVLQERLGWRAGYVQMVLDVAVVAASLATGSPGTVLVSAVGAVVLNLVLALNHRPGRYVS